MFFCEAPQSTSFEKKRLEMQCDRIFTKFIGQYHLVVLVEVRTKEDTAF